MDREQRIEQEVQAALRQLERGTRLAPSPLFFAGVQARLRARGQARGRVLLAGILKPALLMVLVACNIATAALLLRSGLFQGIDRTAVVTALGEELQLGTQETDPFLGK